MVDALAEKPGGMDGRLGSIVVDIAHVVVKWHGHEGMRFHPRPSRLRTVPRNRCRANGRIGGWNIEREPTLGECCAQASDTTPISVNDRDALQARWIRARADTVPIP